VGLPLDGLLVVAVEHAVAAPLATRHLADLGARVIKLERPDGGDIARGHDSAVNGGSSQFMWLNRGKESVAADLCDPVDRALVGRMLSRADIFVGDLGPRAAARLGFSAVALLERHPRLVCCEISGYGEFGPYREKAADDLLIQCEVGLVPATGTGARAEAGLPMADIAAAMYAFSGTLAALLQRERTGLGVAVYVSKLDALAEWMTFPAYHAYYGGTAPVRAGTHHAAIAPYGGHRAGDGAEVFLAVRHEREWDAFCHVVLRDPELVADPRFSTNAARVVHRGELLELVETEFASLTSEQICDRLDQAGIANATLRGPADLIDHPQLAARDRWRTVDAPGGEIRAMLPPVVLGGQEPGMGDVPELGAHTEGVRAEFAEAPPSNAL
jgi:crotonobetainyl-CoA:carnitine CoA-transferase CaiB-like acyl-CoA transferase